MKFIFKNIGLIKEAEINLNGLTVLGGHNDIGKSFIGKTLFSVIQTLISSNNKYKQYKTAITKESVKLFLEYNEFSIDENELLEFIETILNSTEKKEAIYQKLQNMANEIREKLSLQYENYDFEYNEEAEKEITSNIKKLWDNILKLYFAKNEDKHKYAFDLIKQSVFHNEINNIDLPESIAEIKEEELKLHIKIADNKTKQFTISKENPFTDITLIDNPIILNLASVMKDILLFETEFSKVKYQYQLNDLLKKIVIAKSKSSSTKNSNNIINEIEKIISGKVYYDRGIEDFVYQKTNKQKIRIDNTASGIKTFGLIQLLINSEVINSNTLLILDEPEVYLHPEWQLKYAEIICLLVKNNVFIVVSTHSPYMIEALEHYSKKYKLQKKTNFHVGELYENSSVFKDVTSNLEKIYHQLAVPMQKLTFD